MTISLYDISLATHKQVLGAVDKFLDKSKKFCNDNGIDLEDIVETRLRDDMRPFRYQIFAVGLHSLTVVEGLMAGEFSRPSSYPEDLNFDQLHKKLKKQLAELEQYTAGDVNSCSEKELTLKIPGIDIPFTATEFILSFSLPNLYFHAATAYDILRMSGIPLEKRDFLGAFRLKINK